MELPNLNTDNVNINQQENSNENVIEIEIPYPLFQYLSSEECNLQNVCRICLSVNNPELHPLFSAKEQCVLANMFMAISEVQMSPEDGLPSNICPTCQTEVMNYYEFKMKCVKSDYTLKSVLKGEFTTNDKFNANNNVMQSKVEPEIDKIQLEGIKNDVTDEQLQEDIAQDYLEELKESMSDDETLCIVQDTVNNQKEITIINNKSKIFNEKIKVEPETLIKKGKHQCTLCSKKFHKMKSLLEHMSKRHVDAMSESPFPCGRCKEAFDSEFDLTVHGILHDQGAVWKCTMCQKEFKMFESLYTGRAALRRHISRHMRRRRFACARCNATFVEKCALRRHTRVHTGHPAEKKHACTHCDKRFSCKGDLMAHMPAHGAERGSVCNVCGSAFASKRLLNSHQRVHSSDKPYKCSYCEKRFRHESTRNTHVRTHTGERPYVCAQCGKAFIQHSNMTLHMRTHTGERPYACTMCERKFSSSSTLKEHIRSHTGERPYSCEICGKRFARTSLKNHMRLHSDVRPYECPAPGCIKTFHTQHRLKEHYRLHTGEKPFECVNCPEKFTTKSQLIKHVKKHEKNKKAGKKGIRLMPVTVFDKNIRPVTEPQTKKPGYILVDIKEATPTNEKSICTETLTKDSFVYDKDANVGIDTEVFVMERNPNFSTNSVSYVNDVDYTKDVNLVTVNEGEVSISAASATVDGTTVKLYQYDQSLLQIHSGSGQLTISRISSKMTANF